MTMRKGHRGTRGKGLERGHERGADSSGETGFDGNRSGETNQIRKTTERATSTEGGGGSSGGVSGVASTAAGEITEVTTAASGVQGKGCHFSSGAPALEGARRSVDVLTSS